MKTESMIPKWLRLWVMLAVAACVLAAPAAAQPGGNQIAGFWMITVAPDGAPPYVNFATLTKDGQMINVDPEVGTSVGGWERLKGNTYAVTFTGFVPGAPLRYVVSATATLGAGGQQMSGPFRTELLLMDGTLFNSWTGTVSAWRQAVEPY